MTVTRENVLELLERTTEHSIEYYAAIRHMRRMAKLFHNATVILERGRFYEEVANLTSVAVAEYGEESVRVVVDRVRGRVPYEIYTVSPHASMWIAMALAFAHNPVDEYMDEDNHIVTLGGDIWAQVCHSTRGARGAWDQYAQIHPGMLSMASPGTAWTVNKLLSDIRNFGLLDTHAQLN
jgi:hypothetical protein